MRNDLNAHAMLAAISIATTPGMSAVRADTLVNPSAEYLNRINVSESIQTLGDTPFGETIGLNAGALGFRQANNSHPGIGPTSSLTRSYEASGSPNTYGNDLPMADWNPSIPGFSSISAPRWLFQEAFQEWRRVDKAGESRAQCSRSASRPAQERPRESGSSDPLNATDRIKPRDSL